MARPHPEPRNDLALLALHGIVNSTMKQSSPPEQNQIAALTLGLLIGKASVEIADWLLWAEEGENDREARRQGIDQDTAAINAELQEQIIPLYTNVMRNDRAYAAMGQVDDPC